LPFLRELEVLVVDCQSTGANPRRGSLLEVAWSRGRAGGEWSEVASHLVRLPRGKKIPARISKLTGIQERDMADALPPHAVRRRLEANLTPTIAVAHFARFEGPFLDVLCGAAFPLELVCTHEIACRLLPGLPRRGLRAVAGYLGWVMEESKRAAGHARATAAVWSGLVERLSQVGVETLNDLRAWTERTTAARRGGREYPLAREKRLELPDLPGVYRFCAKNGRVLYVGKATSLKRRVNSYFQHRRHSSDKTPELLTQAFGVETTPTATPLEAALLEVDQIREHAPPYNVALRAGRTEVCFASRDFLRVRRQLDEEHPVGPLPRPGTLEPIVALRDRPRFDDPIWTRVIGARTDVEPGYRVFLERHGPCDRQADLLRLGARLWRLERTGEEELDGPEKVARQLESALRHAVHMLRRARWLRRLVGGRLSWEQRTLRVDQAHYDRLRVLTTELRRVAARPGTELVLGDGSIYDGAALRRKLKWL